MSNALENRPVLRIFERRQFQFDELDQALLALQSNSLTEAERSALELRVMSLKDTISVQGSDGCEFVWGTV